MIDELRTLIEIARAGTFAAAGNRLGLTQSAVSGQMKRLEAMLGFSLFNRSGRSATLNAAGLRTLDRARELTELFDGLGKAQDDEPAEKVVRIGAIASAQSTLLARALGPLRQRFPKLRVHVMPGLSIHLLDRLDAGELDIAIMVRPTFGLPAHLSWTTLAREPYVLAVPASAPDHHWRTLIQTEPFLRYDRTSFGGRHLEHFLRHEQLSPIDAIELDDLNALIAMVGEGLGVALVPVAEGHQSFPANVRTIPLGDAMLFRETGFVENREKSIKPEVAFLAASFLDVAGSTCRADLREAQRLSAGTTTGQPGSLKL